MSKRVFIPFLSIFRERMLSEEKTCTSRTKRYGKIGDTFFAFGSVFTITMVDHHMLNTVASAFYRQEGFQDPADFITCWKTIHSRKGYNPYQRVYIHFFKKEQGVKP